MNYTEFAQEVHALAVEKGWWEPAPDFATFIALCHAELSEALEEYRNGRPMVYVDNLDTQERCTDRTLFGGRKPEGIAVELADCVIRMLDWCAAKGRTISLGDGWPRGYFKESACFDLPKLLAELHFAIGDIYENENCTGGYPEVIWGIQTWLAARDIDLWEVARLKHEYNKTRPWRHNGKVI